jgi:hypothetical protein
MRKSLIFNELYPIEKKIWPYQKKFVYLHKFTIKISEHYELVHKMD